jgi:hypothetical protein
MHFNPLLMNGECERWESCAWGRSVHCCIPTQSPQVIMQRNYLEFYNNDSSSIPTKVRKCQCSSNPHHPNPELLHPSGCIELSQSPSQVSPQVVEPFSLNPYFQRGVIHS